MAKTEKKNVYVLQRPAIIEGKRYNATETVELTRAVAQGYGKTLKYKKPAKVKKSK